MTGSEYSARCLGLRPAMIAEACWRLTARLPQPETESRIEDDAVLPEDDDPWLEDEDFEGDELPASKRPFWNR